MRRAHLTFIIASLAVLAAGSPAEAAGRFTLLGTGLESAVKSDGASYAAYLDASGTTRVLGGDGRQVATFQTPPGATLQAVGGGNLLWDLTKGSSLPTARILDIATGLTTDVGPEPWYARGFSYVTLADVGRYWMSAGAVGYHYAYSAYLNWRTGIFSGNVSTISEPRNTARNVPDVDAPALWRRLCRPLHRRSAFDPRTGAAETGDQWLPYQYEYPYGLRRTLRGTRLLLDRCGRRRSRTLSSCRGSCGDARLGAGIVVWGQGSRVRSYRPKSRCKRAWSLPRPRREFFGLALTDGMIYASFTDPQFFGRDWTVYVARVPSC